MAHSLGDDRNELNYKYKSKKNNIQSELRNSEQEILRV